MMFFPSLLRNYRLASVLLMGVILGPLSSPSFAQAPPSAQELLALVRANESQQTHDLTGQLKVSSVDKSLKVPFRLTMRPGEVTYAFANPAESLTLKLSGTESSLLRTDAKGKSTQIGGSKLDGLVRGTDITYEDLALKFLYWNEARVVASGNAMTRKCWIVEVKPPKKSGSQYDRAELWIEKTGGLLRAECFSKGKVVKRFEVRSVQRGDGGGYILKSMRIQSLDGDGRDRSPTLLELNPA